MSSLVHDYDVEMIWCGGSLKKIELDMDILNVGMYVFYFLTCCWFGSEEDDMT